MEPTKPICSTPKCIYTDQWIICSGPCSKSFHAVCVGLLNEDLRVVSSSEHILWVCDECLELFRSLPTPALESSPIEEKSGAAGEPLETNDEVPEVMEVKQCSSSSCIYTSKFVCCNGKCGESFHAVCVKLQETDLGTIASNANLIWLCSKCGVRFRNMKSGKAVEEPDSNDVWTKLQMLNTQLLSQLGQLDTSLANLSKNEEPVAEAIPALDSESSKTSEAGEVAKTEESGIAKSTVQDGSKLWQNIDTIVGKTENKDSTGVKDLRTTFLNSIKEPPKGDNTIVFQFGSSPAKPLTDANNNPLEKHFTFAASPAKPDLRIFGKFYLWLAYFEGNTTEADISYLVRKQMKLSIFEPLKVTKLSKKRASFKVEMDARLKVVALEDATWPKSLAHHREFHFYR